MPSLFKKIFGKKNKASSGGVGAADNGASVPKKSRKQLKKEKASSAKQQKETRSAEISLSKQPLPAQSQPQAASQRGGVLSERKAGSAAPVVSPRVSKNNGGQFDSPIKHSNNPGFENRSPRATDISQDENRDLSNQNYQQSPRNSSVQERASSMDKSSSPTQNRVSKSTSPTQNRVSNSNSGLSHQQLRHFDNQMQYHPHGMMAPYGNVGMDTSPARNMKLTRLSNGQLAAMDAMATGSPVSSSDFCLSTDAEDVEYNQMRQQEGYQIAHPKQSKQKNTASDNKNNTSNPQPYSQSPTNYTTDEEGLFPALKGKEAEEPQVPALPMSMVNGGNVITDDEDDNLQPGGIHITLMAHETEDDMRAWTPSPKGSDAKNENTAMASSPRFTFQGEEDAFSPSNGRNASKTRTNRPPSPVPGFTGHKNKKNEEGNNKQSTAPMDTSTDMYADSTDSEVGEQSDNRKRGHSQATTPSGGLNQAAALLPNPPEQLQKQQQDKQNDDGFGAGFADFDNVAFPIQPTQQDFASPIRASGNEPPSSPLTQLLEEAKEKERKRLRNQLNSQHGSSSVNSAPVVTASFLRSHHNLRSAKDRLHDSRDARSHHSSNSAADAAKDLLRRRRKEKDREHSRQSHRRHRSRTSSAAREHIGASDDDNSDNGEAQNNSWLFDEVAGALGPRGAAADMESLSGRSNRSGRSKNSTGNKSHRSHRSHRSHKSTKSNRSRHRSSRHRSHHTSASGDGSVDSRTSRNSRYSHRSTRSALSHMSEQSRSVANDLLRLEMQLAMVGSQNKDDPDAVVTAGNEGSSGVSLGGNSRASRTSGTTGAGRHSSGIARRSKISVIAPPGKLGIILANKTDSKGTVVSGVRTSSVLAEKISPGDRIIAIDDEDVSRMNVKEITTIMARKSEFERILVVLTTPKQQQGQQHYGNTADGPSPTTPTSQSGMSRSPTKASTNGMLAEPLEQALSPSSGRRSPTWR